VLEDSPGQFEVGVGERTSVVGSGQLLLQVDRKGEAPHDRGWSGAWRNERRPNRGGAEDSVRLGQEDTTSAWFGGIMGAVQRRLNGNEFGDTCGAGRKVKVYLSEIGQDELELWGEAYAGGPGISAEGLLEETEKTAGARERNRHGAEFSQDAMPFLDGDTALRGRNAIEELEEASGAAGGEREGHVRGVDNPSQNFFDGVPRGVALAKFFNRNRFFPMGLSGRQWAKNIVDRVKKDTPHVLAAGEGTLAGTNEIVDEDIKGCETWSPSWGREVGVTDRRCVGSRKERADDGGRQRVFMGLRGGGLPFQAVRRLWSAMNKAVVCHVCDSLGDGRKNGRRVFPAHG
jgi:hypothetical protein